MKKINKVNHNTALLRGFTLMEIIMVIGLLAMIFGITSFISIDSYKGSSFRNERDALVGVLQRARNQSMNNLCLGSCTSSKPHGVHIGATEYTIFQGDDYASRDTDEDEIIEIGPLVQIASGSFTEVIFSPLSGDASTIPSSTPTLSLTDTSGHNSVITIGDFGGITWTN